VKVTYVAVRYGPSVAGGAEQACRQLAEHLAADGVDVAVHTTCALDATTWADVTQPGTTQEAGVTVHRHRSRSGREPHFDRLSRDVLDDPARQPMARAEDWVRRQGPVCPDAIAGAMGEGADLLIATPYLYWPTVELARVAPSGRLVLHPAAHDEAPIRLPVFAGVFGAAAGLAFYTDAERRLVERLFPALAGRPQAVVGLGVDPAPDAAEGPLRELAGIGGRPYLLCFGRVDEGKGTAVLARFFATYKRRRPGPLALVYAGPVVHPPPEHPDVVVVGAVDDATKWSALRGAAALVNPSVNESFGIVVLEAWAAHRPALVNARCAATAELVRRSCGGLTFSGYASFEAAVDRIVGDARAATTMADAGRAYAEQSFSWPVVTGRYRAWLERLADSPSGRLAGP